MTSLDWFVGRVHYLLQAGYATMTQRELGSVQPEEASQTLQQGVNEEDSGMIDDRRLPGVDKMMERRRQLAGKPTPSLPNKATAGKETKVA